ncbi:GNAT family N-acetyltransferase [Plantactinospora sp. KBS50]|uniref:GNAT family N-acetyltransferase n=1 Tax=Plantactinospora sp. KBS50 TaxID=2024580 RepID=UPI000BAB07D4|nr:GNAT family N-acetyltransferase [Plantactinospora sp. KBS50]ASW53737.1 GNAT family N-acetyltransferase [Plantactinospora sp. KBS50]
MEPSTISEAGLTLTGWRAADAADVLRACRDPDIQRWTTVPSPYRAEHAHDFVTAAAPRAWATGTAAPFAVRDTGTGELLGSCGLVTIDRRERSAEIGYWTAPWARGRGVATRAARAVARWALTDLALRRLVWQAELGNHASRLVALRAGFRVEGRLRLAAPHPRGTQEGWVGTLLPGEVPPADAPADGGAGPYGPGSLAARRAAVFGRPQPELFAGTPGSDLRLRPPADHDLDLMVASCRDPEIVRWTSVPDPYRRDDAEDFVRYCAAAWLAGTGAYYVVADPGDRYLGAVDLRIHPSDPLVAAVGFMIAPEVRGRGYLSAALAALATWGFTSLGLARIEWQAQVGNVASRRAAEKVGFRFEGTLRAALTHRGRRVDGWTGALLPEDLLR